MSTHPSQGWEPDPRKMGNWRSMFEQPRRDGQPPGSPEPAAHGPAPQDTEMNDASPEIDLREYRPWTLQRGRSRPPMMLELRRYDARAGLWQSWAMSYPSLYAVETLGDRMLSLDFGSRLFVIEGAGLVELARRIQQGMAVAIQEYAAPVWPDRPPGAIVTAIRRVGREQPSA